MAAMSPLWRAAMKRSLSLSIVAWSWASAALVMRTEPIRNAWMARILGLLRSNVDDAGQGCYQPMGRLSERRFGSTLDPGHSPRSTENQIAVEGGFHDAAYQPRSRDRMR